jgi:hypothetical protein
MNVIVSETVTLVLENILESNADGAWVELSATEELERLYSNAVDSKQENHITSHAQLISELLIARDMLATGHHRNVLKVTMVNSQML